MLHKSDWSSLSSKGMYLIEVKEIQAETHFYIELSLTKILWYSELSGRWSDVRRWPICTRIGCDEVISSLAEVLEMIVFSQVFLSY